MSYEQWQKDRYGNVTPTKPSRLRVDDEEIDNSETDFDFVGDANVFDDLIIENKNEQ